MLNKDVLRRALSRLDVGKVRALLKSGPENTQDVTDLLVLVRHTGCLIDRYGKGKEYGSLKSLIDLIASYLSGQPIDFLQEFTSHARQAVLITLIFRHIKNVVSELEVAALPAVQQAWSVIDWAGSHLSILHGKAMNPPSTTPLLARAGAAIVGDEDGNAIDPDEVVEGTEQYLRMTLSMLAHENGWWQGDGKLCVPPPTYSNEEDLFKAGAHIYLASIWNLVADASETLRFWGKGIKRGDMATGKASSEPIPAIVFDLNLGTRLYFSIARMRMIQMEMDVHMSGIGLAAPDNFKDIREEKIALPPNEFVSFDEMATSVLLDTLYHYDMEEGLSVAGLTPAKLIRGYAVIRRYFSSSFESAQIGVVEVHTKEIVRALQNCSLTQDEALAFLNCLAFGHESRDLFDCPLLLSSSGSKYLLQGFLIFGSLPRVVVSQLASMQVEFKAKGTRFEQQVNDLLIDNGVSTKGFTFWVGSEEYQFDAVAVWHQYVFVFECKNYLLPPLSAAQEFYFMQSMDDAVDQVIRLRSALESNLSQLSPHFLAVPAAPIFIPVVLNAMPFSMNVQRKGVFVYDYSALTRFFDGNILVTEPIETDKGWFHVEHLVKKLWAGPSAEPTDLLEQMKNPIQIEAEIARWYVDDVVLRLTKDLAISIPALKKADASSGDLLKAINVDEEVSEHLNRVSAELHERLVKGGKSSTRRTSKDK